MIRIFRAFAWLRFRLLVNGFRGRKSRDVLERASRAGAILVPIVLVLVLAPFTVLFGVFGFMGGLILGRSGVAHPELLSVARLVLLVPMIVILIAPILRSIHGSSTNLTRLLLLPIPRRLLHLSEVISGVADPWIVLLVPAVLLMPIGFVVAGAPLAGLIALCAGIAFLAFLLLLGSLCAFLVQLVFRDRKRGELLTLLALGLLSFGGFLPMVMQRMVHGSPRSVQIPLGAGSRFLPSELLVATIRDAANGSAARALAPLLGLVAICAVVYAASRRTYRALLDSPGLGSGRRRATSVRVVSPRIPGLSPAASAVAWVQVRSVLRTVTGKMLVYMNPILLAILAVVFPRMGGHSFSLSRLPVEGGVLLVAGGIAFTLLSLERVLLNQFAVDRAGLTLAFLSPVSDRELIVGKMVGGAALVFLPLLVFVALAFLIAPGTSPLLVLAVLLGGLSAYLLLAPAAALCAAVLPKPADLSRMGSASNPHGAASLIGFFLTMTVLAPPAGLILSGAVLGESALLACALAAAWAGLCALFAIPLVRVAAAALAARRENLAFVAQGR